VISPPRPLQPRAGSAAPGCHGGQPIINHTRHQTPQRGPRSTFKVSSPPTCRTSTSPLAGLSCRRATRPPSGVKKAGEHRVGGQDRAPKQSCAPVANYNAAPRALQWSPDAAAGQKSRQAALNRLRPPSLHVPPRYPSAGHPRDPSRVPPMRSCTVTECLPHSPHHTGRPPSCPPRRGHEWRAPDPVMAGSTLALLAPSTQRGCSGTSSIRSGARCFTVRFRPSTTRNPFPGPLPGVALDNDRLPLGSSRTAGRRSSARRNCHFVATGFELLLREGILCSLLVRRCRPVVVPRSRACVGAAADDRQTVPGGALLQRPVRRGHRPLTPARDHHHTHPTRVILTRRCAPGAIFISTSWCCPLEEHRWLAFWPFSSCWHGSHAPRDPSRCGARGWLRPVCGVSCTPPAALFAP